MSLVAMQFQSPGLQTTLQDFGRTGHQHLGVPVGGAMDRRSAAIANRLVGNPDSAAVFEITLLGPTVRINGTCRIALAGADLSARVNGQSAALWQTIDLSGETILSFGKRKSGCRCYLAVGGEIQAPTWLDSVSPVAAGMETGLASTICTGQVFQCEAQQQSSAKRYLAEHYQWDFPTPGKCITLPVSSGPEWEWFCPDQQEAFLNSIFIVQASSNRMGYRLGQFIDSPTELPSMISSGVTPGTIQVTSSGQPILLMRDAQTTGGYPRLAVVDYEALNLAAQVAPGDYIQFALNDGDGPSP